MKSLSLIFLSSSVALAAEGAAGEVPKVVFYQALNVVILFGILTYFLKDKVKAHFSSKRDNYLRAAREVAELKKKVEEQAATLRQKIRSLDETADAARQKAEVDAQAFNQKLLTEAREQAEKLKRETEKTITAEVYRAVEGLRAEIVDQAIKNSREIIQKQIKDSDQKRLQSEFVEKIRVVEQ